MKRKLFSIAFVAAALLSLPAFAQRTTSGTVTAASNGEALPSVAVRVKGTNLAAVTNFDGKYSISASQNAVLIFSALGYATQEVAASGAVVNVKLSESSSKLDEVVVTALGITRDKKTVGYAIQEVSGAEVTKVKDANFMASLSGKVAGVTIRQSGTMGGSSNVVVRGYKSLTGNNQALFVVDGIPISNDIYNSGNQRTGRGGYDYGNAAMDINPEDIDKVTILKGAAATALYGSRAANGVVLISTKRGSARKGLGVTLSSGLTVGSINPDTFVKYQKSYGPGYGSYYGNTDTINGTYTDYRMYDYDFNGDGTVDMVTPMEEDASFGMRFDPNLMVYTWESMVDGQPRPFVAGANDPTSFWENSATFNNNLSIDGGSDNGSFRLSATKFDMKGIQPNSSLQRNTFNFSGNLKASNRLTVSTVATFTQQKGRGRSGTGYDSRNVNQSFRQWFNVGADMAKLKQYYDETKRNISWNPYGPLYANPNQPHYFDNPYYMVNENYQNDQRNRLIGNMTANYRLNDWLDVTARANVDTYSDLQEERVSVSSVDVPEYTRRNRNFTETNLDLILTANRMIGSNINFNGNLGTNVRRTYYDFFGASTNGGLVVPGVYSLSNSVSAPAAPSEQNYTVGVDGYFGRASFLYKDYLSLDLTARYDISSTLPSGDNQYLYPSASLGLIFSELIDADGISFGKVRANFASVGSDAPAGALRDIYVMGTPFNGTPLATAPSTSNNPGLLPETTTSYEAGLEMQFADNRFGFDLTAYRAVSQNQIMPARVSSATGTIFKYVNAGIIENQGVELVLNASAIRTKDVGLDFALNYTRNRNKVVELFGDAESLQLTSNQGGIQLLAKTGEAYGTLFGIAHQRDVNGLPIVYPISATRGYRYLRTAAPESIGNINPDWYGGLNTSFRYKNLTASVLLDMQMGGSFFSLDTWYGFATGIYDRSAGLNDRGVERRELVSNNGGVNLGDVAVWDGSTLDEDGNPVTAANTEAVYGDMNYYGNTFGYARNAQESHVWDASFIKLREVAINYSFPMDPAGSIKGFDLSLVGRNLAILWKNAPYTDPEYGLSAGNLQGYQSGAYPAVREIGLNAKLKF
ncbi:MAG: SusC/RagA family protein [Flavobacteriales bacterium]|nr:MAG: SusC/RagA family protein [Flavobacteriales bacterium]